MNPLPLVVAELRRSAGGALAVIALLSVAVGLAVAIGAQERALRVASARAADRFDLLVGAPGSPTQLVLTTVYLQPAALELVSAEALLRLQQERAASLVAPIAVTDSYRGYPLVGTTAAFATDGGRLGPAEGRVFESAGEALVGAAVDLPLGVRIRPAHGGAAENLLETHEHDATSVVVGRLARTGTAWDRAIVVPIEAVWAMHGTAAQRAAGVAALGPPWSRETAGPVPAIAVRPRGVDDAYRLRQGYRGSGTMALFPAEALNPLYALLGDVGGLMRGMALAFDALLAACVVLALAAVLSARRGSVGVLRALGAPPRFVFAAVWSIAALLLVAGALGGLALGAVINAAASHVASSRLGFAIDAGIGVPEVATVLALLAAGSVLALVPSLVAMRIPVGRLLRPG